MTRKIRRHRGDTVADEFVILDSNKKPQNITGWSFKFTLDTLENPPNATTKVLDIVGTITSAAGGVVEFPWTAGQADQTPATYYYDVQATTDTGAIETIEKGEYDVVQDITK
jgi:hypothetical protein